MATQYSFGKIITDGLVLCLDAADRNSYVSGSITWRDVAGSNNGTLTNGPTFNTSNGGSIVFDGVNDYVDLGNNATLRPAVFTQQSWIYTIDSNSRQQGIFATYSEPLVAGFFVQLIDSPHVTRFVVGTNTGGGYGLYADVRGGITINTNTWYQISISYDGTTMKSYVNGILDINYTWTSGMGYDIVNNKVSIGSIYTEPLGFVSFFKGNISNSILYNRILSQQEVLQNYNAQKSRFGLS